MNHCFKMLFISAILFQCSYANIVIHVMNPWRADTSAMRRESLRIVGNSVVGFYPGRPMIPEGNSWFYYNFTTFVNTDTIQFYLATWMGPIEGVGIIQYSRKFTIDSLFAQFPTTTREIWISIPDTSILPKIYDSPPGESRIQPYNIMKPMSAATDLSLSSNIIYVDIYDITGRCVQKLTKGKGWTIGDDLNLSGGNGQYFIKTFYNSNKTTIKYTKIR